MRHNCQRLDRSTMDWQHYEQHRVSAKVVHAATVEESRFWRITLYINLNLIWIWKPSKTQRMVMNYEWWYSLGLEFITQIQTKHNEARVCSTMDTPGVSKVDTQPLWGITLLENHLLFVDSTKGYRSIGCCSYFEATESWISNQKPFETSVSASCRQGLPFTMIVCGWPWAMVSGSNEDQLERRMQTLINIEALSLASDNQINKKAVPLYGLMWKIFAN